MDKDLRGAGSAWRRKSAGKLLLAVEKGGCWPAALLSLRSTPGGSMTEASPIDAWFIDFNVTYMK
ncbi:hypothetical protein V8Z74_03845 [Comamonas sp. w2-DMI]|uniref:hypothetical protein n=1 Tax=Comamonas sp. w2-DMI TaxID=3126391 RepID=UPI0032E4ADD8